MTEERESKSDLDNLLEDLEFLRKWALDGVPYAAFGIKSKIEKACQGLREYISNKDNEERT